MYRVLVDGALLCDSKIDELAIINPVVTLQVNSAGSFSFTLPAEHPKRDLIKRRKSIISVHLDNNAEPIFKGIATEENVDFYNQKSFVCEGELSYFNDSIQRQAHYSNLTARQLLETYINVHNSQVDESKRFVLGQVNVEDSNNSISCYTNMNTTLKEIKEDLLDDLGGYLRLRHSNGRTYIDYLSESPHTATQVIELGKNLLDYKSNINNTEIATSIIPLGTKLETETVEGLEQRLDIKSVNNGKDYVYSSQAVQNYGWITKVITWDDVTVASNLKAKGEQYLADSQFENVVLEISAIDFGLISNRFEQFRLLDQIRVISEPHGMDRYFLLTKQTFNLNEPEKNTIVLGTEEKLSLSAKTNAANAEILKKIEQVPTSSAVQSAINNATALLKGVDGGYIRIITNDDGQPTEIRIQDALDSPTKVWRWNLNGLGYSSDGGETYGTAITMNGAIVADYITSGTMSANRLRGGTLSLGGANNVNGQAYIYNASGTQYGTWNNAGLVVGSTSAYQIKLKTDGSIVGSSSNVDVGSIKYDASHIWTIEGTTNTYKGVTIKSDDIKLESTLLDITAEYVNVKKNDATYYYGTSGTFTAVTSITYSYVDNVVADLNFYDQSWNNTRIPYVSNYQTKGLYFHKGLMTTSL